MHILLNGDSYAIEEETSLNSLIQQLGLSGQRIAVEVNGEIVPRSEHAAYILHEGDKVEVVRAIGGG